jgi:hypothetical protein
MLAGNTAFSPGVFESIATAVGTGSPGSITFSSIPNTYKHLQIRGLFADGGNNLNVIFNGSSSSNYTRHIMSGTGSAYTSAGAANQTSIDLGVFGASGTGNSSITIIDIQDYASTSINKTLRAFSGYTGGASDLRVVFSSGARLVTDAITSISLVNNATFTTGTVFSLYGIKG